MDAKEEVKQRLSVEEVISDYLELKRSGRNFKAISPFTSEKTASFMVSPEKQIWHDFSSNKGGDMFSFIMEVEGVGFREALEMLAQKANVDLTQYQKKGGNNSGAVKKRLLAAMKAASEFYHIQLSKNEMAKKYVKEQRRFTAETIRQWQLGYSPEAGGELYAHLKKRGFSESELSKAGLITKRRGGWGDMFRGRVMVPLADGQGNVVGFTARLLKDSKDAPKYFNTPQTLIYDKGRQVFGLHHAKEAIRKEDRAVLVEGNLDVIASHQVGVSNVVAAAGTAMTVDHLRSLSRLSLNVLLAFDADQAGLNATERAIPIAQSVGMDLKVVIMPKDIKDPDELIQKDSKVWRQQIDSAVDAVTWVLHRYGTQFDKTTAEGKRQLSSRALAVIQGLQDPVEREHHLETLARELGVSVSSLVSKLSQTKRSAPPKRSSKAQPANPDQTAYEDDFLALNVLFPDVRDSLRLVEKAKLCTPGREAVKTALTGLDQNEPLGAELVAQLNLDEDYVKILSLTAEEKYASWNPADVMAEAMALARRIVTKSKEQYKNQLTAAIREAEERGDHKKAAELLKSYQDSLKKE